MSRSIAHIRNRWLRRAILIVSFGPLMVAAVIIGSGIGAIEWMKDCFGAWRTAWRGYY